MEIFWKTIGLYNSSTWVYQIFIIIAGILSTIFLIKKNGRRSAIAMKLFLIVLYLWISVVYFYIYCEERNYNELMSLFWGVLVATWICDLIIGYTTFERSSSHSKLAYLLLIMPFLYPVTSLLQGKSFPEITSPVMPCSAVVFTLGILQLFSKKINLFLILLLCHWSLIGLSKTYFFNIPEDFLMAGTTIPAIYLFFKQYFLSNPLTVTKPQIKYMDWMLIGICTAVGAILIAALIITLSQS